MKENLQAYETDASMITGKAADVLFPESAEEIARIVKMNTNIVIRGAGTGLVGGAVPQNSVVIDLNKMNKILEIDTGKSSVLVQAGIVLDDLDSELEQYGLEFPVKPSSHQACTIGGMIATNAVGNRGIKYGKTSEWILELEIVDGKGEIQKIGKTELSDFAGMEGITGIIVTARLKLVNRKIRTASLIKFESIEGVVNAVTTLKLDNSVCAIEFLDKVCSSVLGFGESYHLIVEYESDKGGLKGEGYRAVMGKRYGLYPVLARLGYAMIEDPKILIGRFAELASFLEAEKVPFYGHIGSGIIHPMFQKNEEAKIEKLMKFVKKLHGQVSGEHGIGLRKKEFLEANDKKLVLLVKRRRDPACKINCGKVIDVVSEKSEMSDRAKERLGQAEKIIEQQNKEASGEKNV